MWQECYWTWSGAHISFFKFYIPRNSSISSWHWFWDCTDWQMYHFMEDFFMECLKQLTPSGRIQVNFSILKKTVMTSTLCPLSSFSVPVSTIICLFSENPVKFAVTFIRAEKEIMNHSYKCTFHSQITLLSAPIQSDHLL